MRKRAMARRQLSSASSSSSSVTSSHSHTLQLQRGTESSPWSPSRPDLITDRTYGRRSYSHHTGHDAEAIAEPSVSVAESVAAQVRPENVETSPLSPSLLLFA